MTPKDFVAWVQGYYGPYPEGQKRDVWEYIKSWEPDYLGALKTVLLANYSSQFKRAPDIEAMTKLYSLASSERESRERAARAATILPPPEWTVETDEHKTARLRADMAAAGVTFDSPHWFAITFKYRQDRGDYDQFKGPRRGGVIHKPADLVHPRPFKMTPADTVERESTTWEELGGRLETAARRNA